MLIKYGTGTDKGRVRDRNEDNSIVVDCKDYMVFAVADGMGGMDFGDVASSTAVECIKKELSACSIENLNEETAKVIFNNLFNIVNSEIISICVEKRSVTGMGTTLSVCIMTDSRLFVGHMGDSRIYIIKNGGILQITKDHSYVEELIDCGRITREQAKSHPNRNIITRALGLDRDIVVDTGSFDMNPGDRILLCTDGLSNAVEDTEIAEIVCSGNDPQTEVGSLIDLANERGGKDNITVQLIYKED